MKPYFTFHLWFLTSDTHYCCWNNNLRHLFLPWLFKASVIQFEKKSNIFAVYLLVTDLRHHSIRKRTTSSTVYPFEETDCFASTNGTDALRAIVVANGIICIENRNFNKSGLNSVQVENNPHHTIE